MRWTAIAKYTAKRLLMSVLVLFLVTIILFVVVRLSPGDPVQSRIGPYGDYSPENIARIEAELGLDKPIYMQYLIWVKDCLHGDLGVSLRNGAELTPIIMEKLKIRMIVG